MSMDISNLLKGNIDWKQNNLTIESNQFKPKKKEIGVKGNIGKIAHLQVVKRLVDDLKNPKLIKEILAKSTPEIEAFKTNLRELKATADPIDQKGLEMCLKTIDEVNQPTKWQPSKLLQEKVVPQKSAMQPETKAQGAKPPQVPVKQAVKQPTQPIQTPQVAPGKSIPQPATNKQESTVDRAFFEKFQNAFLSSMPEHIKSTVEQRLKNANSGSGGQSNLDVIAIVQKEYNRAIQTKISTRQLGLNIEDALNGYLAQPENARSRPAVDSAKGAVKEMLGTETRSEAQNIAAKLNTMMPNKLSPYRENDWEVKGSQFACSFKVPKMKDERREIAQNLVRDSFPEQISKSMRFDSSLREMPEGFTRVTCTFDPYEARALIENNKNSPPDQTILAALKTKAQIFPNLKWKKTDGGFEASLAFPYSTWDTEENNIKKLLEANNLNDLISFRAKRDLLNPDRVGVAFSISLNKAVALTEGRYPFP